MNENRNFIVGALVLAAIALGSAAYFANATVNNQTLPASVMEDLRGRLSLDIGNIAVQGSDIYVGYYQRSNDTVDVQVLARELADKAQQQIRVHAVPVDQVKLAGTATAPEEWCSATMAPGWDHATGTCFDQLSKWSMRIAKAKANVEKARQKVLDSMVIVVPLVVEE